jgi:DNA-binding beta-propeller fold protein YncE
MNHACVRITRALLPSLSIGLLCFGLLVASVVFAADTWLQVPPSGPVPDPRAGHSFTYIPSLGGAVAFGGFNSTASILADVWLLSLGASPSWTQLVPTGTPPGPRDDHAAIYDPVRNRILIFAGSEYDPPDFRDDVWALSLGSTPTWSQLLPTGTPPAVRRELSAVYDPLRDRMIVFGGKDPSAARNDVWALSLSGTPTWTEITPLGPAPSPRYGASAIYDAVRDRLIVFGGTDGLGTFYNDTWALPLSGPAQWSLISASSAPVGRYGQTAIYDPADDQLVVFGGYNNSAGGAFLGDVWALPLGATPVWTNLAVSGGPGGRYNAKAIYDPQQQRLVTFGGDDPTVHNDTWTLQLAKPCPTTATAPPFRFAWGSLGSGNGQFSYPTGIAVDASRNVYVVDMNNNCVQKFTSTGSFLSRWGSLGAGNGQFQYPTGIAVDGGGNVYVVDWQNYRIAKFTSSGTALTTWGSRGSGNGQFDRPWGIAIDAAGNVYVSDVGNNRIQKFTGSGEFVTAWGSAGSSPGQFNSPVGIAVDGSGTVYVADSDNNRIQKFTGAGQFLGQWTVLLPGAVAVGPRGEIYVETSNRIQVFNCTGDLLTEWGGEGSGDGQFQGPYGIAVDPTGDAYVLDLGNERVQIFGSLLRSVYTISSSAGLGGAVSPSGEVRVIGGDDRTFTITPDLCHEIANVVVDETSKGPMASYTFTSVSANHTIAASFAPSFTIASASFDRMTYTTGDIATVTVTLQSPPLNTSALLTVTIHPHFDQVAVLAPRTIDLSSGGTQTVNLTWVVPEIHGLTLTDLTVIADAGSCGRRQGDYSNATTLTELTPATATEAQQQLQQCGTTTARVCEQTPESMLIGAIPLVGLATGAFGMADDGCLAVREWRDGRHFASAAMWLATGFDALGYAIGAAGTYACVASGPLCLIPQTAAQAIKDVVPGALSAMITCTTSVYDNQASDSKQATGVAHPSSVDPMFAWLPDSLENAIIEKRDDVADLVVCTGPSRLRIEAEDTFTTADSVGHWGACVLVVANHPIQCAIIQPGVTRLLGPRPQNQACAATIRVLSTDAGSTSMNVFHRQSTGEVIKLAYAPMFLQSGGSAWLPISADSTLFALVVDENGDGLPDWRYYPGGIVTAVAPLAASRPGSHGITSLRVAPNPFSTSTTLLFELDGAPIHAHLIICDVSGRQVLNRDLQLLTAGSHAIRWDGHDSSGARIPTGVYFCKVAYAEGLSTPVRMVVIQ